MAAKDNSPPGGFAQGFEHSEIRSGDGRGGGRGGDVGSHNSVDNSSKVNNTTMNFYGPQIIVNSEGQSLDFDMADKKSVISYPFHGGINQQWLVHNDGNGGVALMSKYNKTYVAMKGDTPGTSSLVSSKVPFYWDISKNQGTYQLAFLSSGFFDISQTEPRLGVPNSGLVLNIGDSASVGPPSGKNSQIFIVENTPENQAAVKNGKVASLVAESARPSPTVPNSKAAPNFNVTINDFSGSGNAANALKNLENFFSSDGITNLMICLGHHQVGFVISGANPKSLKRQQIPNSLSLANTDSSLNPTSSTSPAAPMAHGMPLAADACTGFPTGYFRIRTAGPNAYYITPRFWETNQDGNSIALWTLNLASDAQVFFVNVEGKLCCGGNGAYVDILGNTLIVAHNRPPTQPWPNPWSHPLPTFTYSKETRLITVKPYIDPSPSANWPRPENDWKGKQLLLAGQSTTATQVPSFSDVSSWAPGSTRTATRWTIRAGVRCEANTWYNLGIEERTTDTRPQDLDRMKWEIEPA
ncbi:hypothetical protein CPB84DRAFT_1844722 [Gymnopilus junonius]|uniref:Ricin B lectin domain-containing protein n=1 Tax=Gymnopilus junonius TaxID=109634 RepID=A0A9P5TPL8_GYMJU|nr:hypothetical protein CPB84DRAFT_1844722 [Gymnopilus junonius]